MAKVKIVYSGASQSYKGINILPTIIKGEDKKQKFNSDKYVVNGIKAF